MPAHYETRAQRVPRDKRAIILFLYVLKRFKLNGRASDERQPAIVRSNGCFEQGFSAPAQQPYEKESAQHAD
jgi:hypothetical protein